MLVKGLFLLFYFHLEQKYQTGSLLAHQTELRRHDVIIYFHLFCTYFADKLVLLKLSTSIFEEIMLNGWNMEVVVISEY